MTKHSNQGTITAEWPPESTCFFPRLNVADQNVKTAHSVAVEMPSSLLSNHLKAEKIPLSLFLSAVWAVTLRCFTECERVHLWVAEGPARSDGTVELLTCQIDAQTTMQALCQSQQWARVHKVRPEDISNVGIVFEEEEGGRLSSRTLPDGCDLALMNSYKKSNGQPLVSLHYRDFLLSHTTAEYLADTVQQVVRYVLSRMDHPVRTLQVCSPAQYEKIERWSREDHPVKGQQYVTYHPWWHKLCHQVRLRPDQLAIDAWDGQWSYRQLEEISSCVAAQLQTKGIGPGVMIPVCYEKSVWAIAAAVGVHKSGAAFVPLDPALPASRLQAILEAVDARWVVTSTQQRALFEAKHERELTVMVIDAGTEDLLPSPEKWTGLPSACAQDPAYCLFTSGSTGRPKGCIISHGAFAGITAHAEALQLNDSSRALQFASLAFGMSIIEIYCTLAAGGTICVLSDSDRASLRTMTMAINRTQVTWALMTPTMLGSLVPAEVPCLRTVLTAGETLHKSQLLAWADAVHLHQAFGFTEWAGICCVTSRITCPADRAIIGRPVPNARVWLVDPDNETRLVPIGAVAELCVEGACLAQGYLHDSGRTSEVFVPRPDWGIGPCDEGRRMYRTGDLVRYTCDGHLTYLGRKDTQRKIRGQRLELAEVEYHLRECFPDSHRVLAEVITPLGNHDEAQQVLAAFVLPRGKTTEDEVETALEGNHRWFAPADASFEAQSLVALETLRARLPRYMVPDLVLRLREVPLTVSGKLDRRGLCCEANSLTRAQLLGRKDVGRGKSTDSKAETPLLLQLVSQALNLPPWVSVGIDDNFFYLGGDSIKAMKLVGLAQSNGLRLTVSLIFKHPVFSDLQAAMMTESGSMTSAPPDDGQTTVVETAIIPQLSRELVQTASHQYALVKDQIEDVFPCSPMQEGMMALSLKSPGSYIARLTLTLRTDVDLARVCVAWETVMQRNEIFRTRIVQTDSQQMLQVVMKEPPRCETCATQDEFQERLRNIRMGLGDPLVQSVFVTGPPGSTQPPTLAIILHHSICDRWSLALARQQLDAFYARQLLDQQNQKGPRFRDFIAHIRAVQGADKFWRAQFAGLTLHPFPALPAPTYESSRDSALKLDVSIPPFGGRASYTLSTVIQLAWAVAVSRYTNSGDVVYGLTVTGRAASLAGIETIVGPTVATIPLRIQLNEEQAVEEALTALQLQVTNMAAYEQMGLQHIRNLGADAEAACQFQNQLVVQFAGSAQQSESSDSVIATYEESAAQAGGFASYPLVVTCQLSTDPHTITVTADFDSKLIPVWKVERVLWTLETILTALIKQPHRPMRDLPALSARDHWQLLEWAPTPPPEDAQCLHRVIRQNVLERSSSDAVCAWDGRLNYHELWTLSGYFARYLRHEYGVGPEIIVPLLFEKSQWLPVSVLAVMRAGGAYILLDPSHPPSRLRHICEAVASPFLVASQALTELGQQLGCCSQVITVAPGSVVLSPTHSLPDVNDDQEICPEVQPSNSVYIVFTSGSTGTPKGVVVEHRTYCSSARAHIPGFLMSRTSRVLQWAACAFDMCCLEILSTLLCGGCICIPRDTRNVDRCVAAMNEFEVTLAIMTPSFARALQHQGDSETLRTLVLVGEAASEADIRQWPLRVRLLNGYGPAECSAITTVQSDMRTASSPANIGFPTNARCWLVHPDDPNRLVPIGAVGELLIEGPLVGRGYLNDPVQTASVFLQPPRWLTQEFAGLPHRHLYLTGDLAYRESNGSLCFVGRKDFQIKLRGQRIELGEIERQMQRCLRDSLDVVAELISPVDRSPLIVAFIWEADDPNGEMPSSSIPGMFKPPTDSFRQKAAALDSYLRQVLPVSMVPSLFLPVRSMPRAQTGKMDRRLLRQTAADAFEELLRHYRLTGLDKNCGAPRTEAECILHRIWVKVLNLPEESIGLEDNFFHLGGDSISAMHLAAAARAQGLALAVSDILESPRLATMASRIAVLPLGTEDDSSHPSITPFSLIRETTRAKVTRQLVETGLLAQESQIADILPVTESQSFFLAQWTPVHHCYFIQGPLDVDRLRDACEAVVARHSILRTVFVRAGDKNFQAVMQSINLPFRTEKTEEDLSMYCDSVWSDDCAIGSTVNQAPLRFTLASQSSTRHVFIMRLSHAQYDGVSLPALLNDISMAYSGDPLSQTLDFCSYMHYRSHHDHGSAFSFWRNYLRGATIQGLPFSPTCAGLPPSASSGTSRSRTARIATARNIAKPNPPPGITTANLVKAATAWVLHRHGSPADLVLGQTVTGRSMALLGIDTVLGACVNFIPFRVILQPSWTVMDLLKHVQQQCSATLGYDFMDFSDIARHCTAWPQGAWLPCVIQHQNVDQSPKLALRDAETTTAAWAHFTPPSGLWIMSAPKESSLQVMICTSEQVMSRSTAKELAVEICDVLAVFASSPDRNLASLQG